MTTKKQKIMDAALELFVEKGFDATPTAEISKKAGVATGTLFHHFGTKEELINSIYLSIKKDFANSLIASIDKKTATKSQIRQLWLGMLEYSVNNPNKANFLHNFGYSNYITKETHIEIEETFNFAVKIMIQGIEEEIIKPMPQDFFAEVFSGLFYALTRYFINNSQKFQDPEYQKMAFDLFWNAIKT